MCVCMRVAVIQFCSVSYFLLKTGYTRVVIPPLLLRPAIVLRGDGDRRKRASILVCTCYIIEYIVSLDASHLGNVEHCVY